MYDAVDINENAIRNYDPEVLNMLLVDHTTHQNIFWATNDYEELGGGYEYHSPILPDLITGENRMVIRPRTLKAKELQSARSKEMAEVFTPSWVCNAQNNLIDDAWFGVQGVFNKEQDDHSWVSTSKVVFPQGKVWKEYVRDTRLEITCGEAPYIVSRYDATSGDPIKVEDRIGILDRKLRVISENTNTSGEWLEMAQEAYKNTYAYEWQGDSLLLAREAMLYTFFDYYRAKFKKEPLKQSVLAIANIISWNVWQMDGLKCVVPNSCHLEKHQLSLFDDAKEEECKGCKNDSITAHNGKYCIIKDWKAKDESGKMGKIIRFVDLITKNK